MHIRTLQNKSVPEQPNHIYTFPEFRNWYKLIEHNQIAIGNIDRDECRKIVINRAVKYTQKFNSSFKDVRYYRNLIFTGHQSNWHHFGILAKYVIASEFAKQNAGMAVHLVLDHDITETNLRVFKSDDHGFLGFENIFFGQSCNMPLELQPAPSVIEVEKFLAAIPDGKAFCREVWNQRRADIFSKLVVTRNLADFITYLHILLNRCLGLDMLYIPVSEMVETDCFRNFLAHVTQNAFDFALIYNQAIHEKKIKSAKKFMSTIRPLKRDSTFAELPFWIVLPDGQRAHFYVHFERKQVVIQTDSEILVRCNSQELQEAVIQLRERNYRIRPKAVSLSLFCRLYLADIFVHGIGASQYEYITDHMISKYYQLPKLNYGIATATKFPYVASKEWDIFSGTDYKSKLRQCAFNPEKFITHFNSKSKMLVNAKYDLISLANNPETDIMEKSKIHQKLLDINESLIQYTGLKHIIKDGNACTKVETCKHVLNYREFFYGLFTRQEVQNLIRC